MSGSPLADRLVEKTGEAIWDEIKKYPTPPPWSGAIPGFHGATKQDVGRVAVAAMARELAEWLEEERRDFISIPKLERLAVSVEKGEKA